MLTMHRRSFASPIKRQKPLSPEEEEDLMEGVGALEEFLDVDGVDEDFLEGVEMTQETITLPDDEAGAREREEAYFDGFLAQQSSGRPPPMNDTGALDAEELRELQRKLGNNVLVHPEEVEELRAQDELNSAFEERNVHDRTGFEQRGHRMTELEEQQGREKAERERQRRIHIDADDRLCVGDVVIPFHLEKWISDPTGDHRRRYKRQRQKEERLKEWYEKHGMYYQRRKSAGFRRDPINEELTVRQRRIGGLLKRALEESLAEDLEHESVPGVMIEDVQVSVDMKRAKILWNCLDGDERNARNFLFRMTPSIRHAVTKRAGLKHSPVLDFVQTDQLNQLNSLNRAMDAIESDREEATIVSEKD